MKTVLSNDAACASRDAVAKRGWGCSLIAMIGIVVVNDCENEDYAHIFLFVLFAAGSWRTALPSCTMVEWSDDCMGIGGQPFSA